MIAKRFALNDPTLHIPVVDSDDFWYVRVSDENAQIGEFYIAVTAAKGVPSRSPARTRARPTISSTAY